MQIARDMIGVPLPIVMPGIGRSQNVRSKYMDIIGTAAGAINLISFMVT